MVVNYAVVHLVSLYGNIFFIILFPDQKPTSIFGSLTTTQNALELIKMKIFRESVQAMLSSLSAGIG